MRAKANRDRRTAIQLAAKGEEKQSSAHLGMVFLQGRDVIALVIKGYFREESQGWATADIAYHL